MPEQLLELKKTWCVLPFGLSSFAQAVVEPVLSTIHLAVASRVES